MLEWDAGGRGRSVLSVYDLLGQVVWKHVDMASGSGPQRVVWPGQTQDGLAAATGVYIATLDCAGMAATCG